MFAVLRLLPQLDGVVRIGARVQSVELPKLLGDILHHPFVEIPPAQPDVAVGRQGSKLAAFDLQDRHVERAAAQIVHQHPPRSALETALVRLESTLLITEGQRRGRRLVDDVQHFQPGQASGVLRRLAPRFVEEGRHRDDRLLDRSDPALGVLPQLVQHERAEHFGRHRLAADRAVVGVAAHVAFEAIRKAVGGQHRRLDRLAADHHFVVLEQHGTGRQEFPQPVRDRRRPTLVIQVRDQRVRRPQVDADGRGLPRLLGLGRMGWAHAGSPSASGRIMNRTSGPNSDSRTISPARNGYAPVGGSRS